MTKTNGRMTMSEMSEGQKAKFAAAAEQVIKDFPPSAPRPFSALPQECAACHQRFSRFPDGSDGRCDWCLKNNRPITPAPALDERSESGETSEPESTVIINGIPFLLKPPSGKPLPAPLVNQDRRNLSDAIEEIESRRDACYSEMRAFEAKGNVQAFMGSQIAYQTFVTALSILLWHAPFLQPIPAPPPSSEGATGG